jgi:hypothetical protein
MTDFDWVFWLLIAGVASCVGTVIAILILAINFERKNCDE